MRDRERASVAPRCHTADPLRRSWYGQRARADRRLSNSGHAVAVPSPIAPDRGAIRSGHQASEERRQPRRGKVDASWLRRGLRSVVRRAFAMAAGEQYVRLAINFASIAMVSRLLTPTEIGVSVIGTGIMAIALGLREFATSDFLIQRQEVVPRRHPNLVHARLPADRSDHRRDVRSSHPGSAPGTARRSSRSSFGSPPLPD